MPSRAAITRATSDAAAPIRWIASAIQSTPAIPSASSGLRAASIAIVRRRRRCPAERCVEPHDLLGELLLVEEHGRVGQVDHQLRGVFQLDEQVFDGIRRSIIHVAALPMMS